MKNNFLKRFFESDIECRDIAKDILGTSEPAEIEKLVINTISPYIESDIETN